jgi:hypothetical protein
MAQIFDVENGKRVTYFPADGILDKQEMDEREDREEKVILSYNNNLTRIAGRTRTQSRR